MTAPYRIDAHQHFWSLARGDYGWLTPDLAPLYRDFAPADLQPLLAAHEVRGTVLVQAAPTLAETQWLLRLAAQHDLVRGVVGWVDLAHGDAVPALDALAADPLLKGVRPMLQDLPDPAWIATAPIDAAVGALVRHDLRFDALVKPAHLPHLLAFAQRHPALPIVIDHAAKPDIARGAFSAWRRGLQALAQLPSLHCKLSGLATEAGTGWRAATLRPYAETVLELFGPQRVIWGSDWPVLTLAGGYAEWVAATDELLAPLDDADRHAVWAGNAERFYRLD
ncbi:MULTISPECIES: amidohydrolase [unclassified Rhizobacter]|uniref:amidohydrolase family protein n=1 Tax=unclassified Rhizobacter TaxID=2640088 RepID=UPI0006FEB367|nr:MULTISPECIES: amidohydrolase family protein [unclassified Rhizobacter]KQU78073.1 amidohydrolase [Rhizobacter sp. Root29]KQW15819.1 amidohydrolase [Rhizobacter sp. Root1238]KRB24931.1 amidohydrolase [Rhizobacter sp. Root16D2]